MKRTTLILPLLILVGCEGTKVRNDFGDFLGRAGDIMTGNTASDSAQKMEDQFFPDERREGINKLASRQYGRQAPYTERYQQIAQTDSDYLVRATALRALNYSRDASAAPLFVKNLDDKDRQVRLEAAKALVNVPDETAVPRLIQIARDDREDRDIRIAAADALRNHRKIEVARELVALLNQRDFAVAWQARQSLMTLTASDHGYDEAAWLGMLAENPLS